MGTYLRETSHIYGKIANTHLDIFDGDLEEDRAYNKQMGNKVRYFRIREIKLED